MGWAIRFGMIALAVVASVGIAGVTGIHAQDLTSEWLTVRSAVDGHPATASTADLATEYGVAPRSPGYFSNDADPGTPAQLWVNLPLLAVGYDQLPAAALVLTVGSGLLLAGGVARLGGFPSHCVVAGLPLLLVTVPGVAQLRLGQFSLLVAAGLAWSLVGVRRGSWWAGLPVGAAIGIKVYLWAVIPALWVGGHRRAAVVAAGAAVGLNMAGLVFPGVSIGGLMELSGATSEWSEVVPNNGSAAAFGIPLAISVVAAMVLVVWRRGDPGVAVPVSLLASPIVWIHYLPVALVPAVAARRWWLVGTTGVLWVAPLDWRTMTLVSLLVLAASPLVAMALPEARVWCLRRGRTPHREGCDDVDVVGVHPVADQEAVHSRGIGRQVGRRQADAPVDGGVGRTKGERRMISAR